MKPVEISPVALCLLLTSRLPLSHARGDRRSKAGDSKSSTRSHSRSRNNNGRTKRTRHHTDRDSRTGCNRGSDPTKPDGRMSGSNTRRTTATAARAAPAAGQREAGASEVCFPR
jgi:hypothetical protein